MASYLGQNFLTSKAKIKEIVAGLDLGKGDVVVEIGPGHGELTEEILKTKNVKLIAIEKDKNLAKDLRDKFQESGGVKIVEGDALRLLSEETSGLGKYKIVGNIPYYITGHLLRIIQELDNPPVAAVLTVQKEVAERICAKPPRMNLLAAGVRFWSEPAIISRIPKKYFKPIPKVDSAAVKIKTKEPEKGIEPENYYSFIKILFKQPRKTILNNLAYGVKKNISGQTAKKEITDRLNNLKINPDHRPQNLDFESVLMMFESFRGIIG